jgi:hypothetical protein
MRYTMKLSKALFLIISAIFVMAILMLPLIVSADGGQYGQYGGGADKPAEQAKEEVVHETVEADLGDNLLALAAIAGTGAFALIILSKVTARVYLLD